MVWNVWLICRLNVWWSYISLPLHFFLISFVLLLKCCLNKNTFTWRFCGPDVYFIHNQMSTMPCIDRELAEEEEGQEATCLLLTLAADIHLSYPLVSFANPISRVNSFILIFLKMSSRKIMMSISRRFLRWSVCLDTRHVNSTKTTTTITHVDL